jgi:chemotaxis protein CheD
MAELVVRMGEIAASQHSGDVLVGLGLGSCIALTLVEDGSPVAAMAHIVLPESNGGRAAPGKFADTAVPELIREVTGIGAARSRLSAVLVGGAQMFPTGGRLDIGARNEQAVRAALVAARIPVRATATGGDVGRTMRAYLGTCTVTCKEAGSSESELAAWAAIARVARAA